ncbi:aspartate 1-decarboxylase [Methylosinus sp. H3A]|uniref:aspartate 1-decarboxylase n=1 Tax=Methylosinus sp. H3A TaxID=2785786 RepID=UPI0018C1F4BD|nr:aspartate 1-decarboxylase [Methylosinus sp. H3A]MBG0809973.1 aspartate 1-decarboxylase [Methylosinus sp. H3A]
MYREMMKSKLHRVTVTHADVNYVGSITIDRDLMDMVDLLPNEKVDVVNIANGARLSTYVIPGKRGSGVIGINGAAARMVSPGDVIIVIGYALVPGDELPSFKPAVVFVDGRNRPILSGDNPLALPEDGCAHDLSRPALAEE